MNECPKGGPTDINARATPRNVLRVSL